MIGGEVDCTLVGRGPSLSDSDPPGSEASSYYPTPPLGPRPPPIIPLPLVRRCRDDDLLVHKVRRRASSGFFCMSAVGCGRRRRHEGSFITTTVLRKPENYREEDGIDQSKQQRVQNHAPQEVVDQGTEGGEVLGHGCDTFPCVAGGSSENFIRGHSFHQGDCFIISSTTAPRLNFNTRINITLNKTSWTGTRQPGPWH